jgi:zinc transport system ATP-binding protein
MNPLLLEAKEISVFCNRRTILKDVSLTINERDFITIIGPNGAGKSMLLKCLMEFYVPSKGKIYRRPNLRIGYVPQRFSLQPSFPITTKKFLTLRSKESAEKILHIAHETKIEKLLTRDLSVLSGGELQRVLVARALLNSPDLLILDEPAQNLDISGQMSFYKLLENIYKTHAISILMVSHDLHLVMASSKQVVCLFHHICCKGEPQIITKDPEFIALFGNDMARMMAVYHHEHQHHHEHE